MQEDINDIINKNLPQQVGEILRKRLEQADKDAKVVQVQAERIKELGRDISTLESQVRLLSEKAAKAEDILKREAKLNLDIAVFNAKSEMLKTMQDSHLQVVMAVFQNNRLKYTETRNDGHAFPTAPTPGNPYPCPQTTTTQSSKQVDVEGG